MKFGIRAKLILGFMILILFMLIIGATGIKSSSSLNASLQDVTNNWMPKAVLIEKINFTAANHRIWEVANVIAGLTNDQNAIRDYDNKMQAEREKFKSEMARLNGMLVTAEGKQMYNDLQQQWNNYIQISDQLKTLISQQKEQEALQNIAAVTE
ncbi:MAG: MCP four helix bundle domain-containing protein [Bacillota bacterium]